MNGTEIAIYRNTGKVRYAAVTYGGFLGVGNKMFAVPFDAFKLQKTTTRLSDRGTYKLVLNVTQTQLEGQTGFDEDKWPSIADESLMRDLDTRYGVPRNDIGLADRNDDLGNTLNDIDDDLDLDDDVSPRVE